MSDDGSRLGELFRGEAGEHAQTMASALATLARDARDAAALAGLGRAAHTLRGAAQVVGLNEAARLMQALERFVGELPRGGAVAPAGLAALQVVHALVAELAEIAPGEQLGWETRRARAVDAAIRALRAPGPAPAPAPVPAPAAAAAAEGSIDHEMLGLFRIEVEAQTAVLSDGLLALERDTTHTEGVEALMRAAHSLKGAARILNLDPAVRLAHAMEDHLILVGSGRLPMTVPAADTLLAGTDQLLQLAQAPSEWLAAHAGEMLAMAARIMALRHAPMVTQTVAIVPPTQTPTAKDAAGLAVVPPPPSATQSVATVAAAAVQGPDERVVRVRATHLDKLMGLAGESLVEARRVEPLVTSLRRLGKQQQALTDLVDELTGAEPASELAQRAKASVRELRTQLAARTGELESHARRAEDLTRRLYAEAIASRMRPFADGVRGFPRLVRDLARTLGKSVDLVISGEDVDVDRDILERIEAPINHMLRNAIDHGIELPAERAAAGKPERATLRLEARHWAGMLTVSVADDGRGILPERVRHKIVERGLVAEHTAAELSDVEVLDWLFRPGFSTADEVSLVSGRGVGLDVVRSVVQEIGGSGRLGSEPGRGTSFHLQLPITLSVQRAVVVEIAGEPYAFPLLRIERLCNLATAEVRTLEGRPYFTLEGKNIALIAGAQVLDLGGAPPREQLSVVVIGERLAPVGVIVDKFLGEQDLVVRPLDRRLGKVADLSAAAILPDGTPLLILDVDDMCRSIVRLLQGGAVSHIEAGAGPAARVGKRVLVVDDSISVRELERQVLVNRGYEVAIAVDGMDAWETLRAREFDLVITDVDMPRMNGIELTRSIKQDARLRSIPVMIVSYRENQADRLRGLDAGANYYLTKSNFHDETLVQAVGDLIGGVE